METIDISLTNLALLYAMLVLPLWLIYRYSKGLIRETVLSIVRMTIQLALLGVYLKYIFEWNTLWINVLWILVMLVVANVTTLKNAGLKKRYFFWPTMLALTISIFVIVIFLLGAVVRPEPVYDARYMIPLTGMVLGNSLRGNVQALERFYSEIRKNESEFITYLTMGATLEEAVRPYARDAVASSVSPIVATMATVGLVSLPGMMTGQVLGGSFPLVAIKYQIAIMISIFFSMTLTAVLNILFSLRVAFDDYQMLREEVFN
ncbi:MAG: ABC transporter permease [Chlorobiales bacterium]|nr:ABC transporter permease [Chlorobiales bacterium]